MEKARVVVYGLGKKWIEYRSKIEERYTIVACCDRNNEKATAAENYHFVGPDEMKGLNFDFVIVTPTNYSISEYLIREYGFDPHRVLNFYDVLSNKIYEEQGVLDDSIELTVVIPTYNREEQLGRTIEKLSRQSCQKFDVVIVDNNSSYDIENVRGGLSEEFSNRITIHRNRINIGMHGNLANVFSFAKRGWVWTLSDDDIPTEYAIEIIKNAIHTSRNAGVIMFSLSNMFPNDKGKSSRSICSLNELADFYRELSADGWDSSYSGDFYYISNKVYRADICERYIADIFKNAYSGIPQIYPILKMIDEKTGDFIISNEKIVNYSTDQKISWNLYETALGMSSVADWNIDVSDADREILLRLCSIYYKTILGIDTTGKSEREKRIIEVLYRRIYSLILDDMEKKEYEQYLLKL